MMKGFAFALGENLVCLCSLVLRRNFEWSLALYERELFVAFELQVFSSLQWILSLIWVTNKSSWQTSWNQRVEKHLLLSSRTKMGWSSNPIWPMLRIASFWRNCNVNKFLQTSIPSRLCPFHQRQAQIMTLMSRCHLMRRSFPTPSL